MGLELKWQMGFGRLMWPLRWILMNNNTFFFFFENEGSSNSFLPRKFNMWVSQTSWTKTVWVQTCQSCLYIWIVMVLSSVATATVFHNKDKILTVSRFKICILEGTGTIHSTKPLLLLSIMKWQNWEHFYYSVVYICIRDLLLLPGLMSCTFRDALLFSSPDLAQSMHRKYKV